MRGSSRAAGARGDQRGLVRNTAPLQDREVIFAGSGAGDEAGGETAQWAALSNDTTGLEHDVDHVVGTHSIEFDKVNGTDNKTYGGVGRTYGVGDEIDLSRFQADDFVVAVFKVSAITAVASAHVRLGTDASNYMGWTLADISINAGVWTVLAMRLKDGVQVGNGWDPSCVKYAEFAVNFDLETSVLADVRLDSIDVASAASGYVAAAQGDPLVETGWAALADPGYTPVIDVRLKTNHTILYSIASIDTSVGLIVWGSLDGTIWFVMDAWTVLAADLQDDTREISGFGTVYLKCEFDAEAGGNAAAVTFQYMGS